MGSTSKIDGIVSVVELILDASTREIIDHRTTHGELIEIVVGEMVNDLAHNSKQYS